MEKEKPPVREQVKRGIDHVVVEFEKIYSRAECIYSLEFNNLNDKEKIELLREMVIDFIICFKVIFCRYGLNMKSR